MAEYGIFDSIFNPTGGQPEPATAAPTAAAEAPQDYGIFNDIFKPSPRGNIAEVGRAVARGAVVGAGHAISGIPELVGAPESGIGRIGKRIAGYGQDRFAPTAGREGEYLSNLIPEFVGGVGPLVAAGLGASAVGSPIAGAATTIGLMAAQGAGGEGAAAEVGGATPGQRQAAAAGGALTGAALGVVPFGPLTKAGARLIPALAEPGLRGGLARTGAAGVLGAGIGAGGQASSNLIAGQTYDPSRELTTGLQEAAIVTGAGMGLLHPLVGAGPPRRPPATPPETPPAAPQLLLPPPAIPMYGPEGPPRPPPAAPPPPLALPPPRPFDATDRAQNARTTADAGVDALGPRTAEANQFIMRRQSDPRALVARYESGNRPLIGWGETDLSGYPLSETGFPMWPGKPGPKGNSTAAGLYAITRSTWDPIASRLGIRDFSEESQGRVFDELYRTRGFEPWAPNNSKLAAAIARGEAGEMPPTTGERLALPAPLLRLPRPETTYGDDFMMRDSERQPPATAEATTIPPGGSPFDRASYAVSQLNPGDPVTRRFLARLSGLTSQDQVATLRDRLVSRGLVRSAGGRYTRAPTVNAPETFAPRTPTIDTPVNQIPSAISAPGEAPAQTPAAAGVPEAPGPRPAATLPELGAPLPPGIVRRPAPAAEPPAPPAVLTSPLDVSRETPSPWRRRSPPFRTVRGATEQAFVPSTGAAVPVEYAIMDARQLVTSHRDDLSPNADYPQALQPRSRERAETEAQLAAIINGDPRDPAARFRPELMGESADAANGSPIVGPEGYVESGNARTMAIRRAYDRALPQAEEYRQYLAAQGYPVAGVEQPVLVRINRAELDMPQREQLARDLNVAPQATMSATDRAMADAQQIPGDLLRAYQGGDVFSAANRPLWRGILDRIAKPSELPALTNPEGGLSPAGETRIRNALLAKAYGDRDTIAALTEDADSNIKAIGNALTDVAPKWAMLREAVAAGDVAQPYDLTSPLLEAVRLVAHARDTGRNVAEFVKQRGLFGEGVKPVTEGVLSWLLNAPEWSRVIGRQKVADTLTEYADSVTRPLRLGEARASPAALVENAREVVHGAAGDLFASPLGEPGRAAPVRPGAGENRPEAQGPRDDTAGPAAPGGGVREQRPGADIGTGGDIDRTALRDELYRIVKERAPTLRLRTLDELVGTIEGRPSPIYGSYHTEARPGGLLDHIASIALGGPDPRAALSHEIVHFLKRSGLFSRDEWGILAGKADKWADQFEVNQRYPDQPLGIRREEAVAEAYAAWSRNDLQLPPGLRRIFGKVKDFFTRTGNWLHGQGFQTADDVFGRVTAGEVGGRSAGDEIGGTRYHRAYHGSPYDFEAFDAGKIGSGEGAQAYGHGLYFAGSKAVADYYRNNVLNTPAIDAINRRMSEIADEMWRIKKPGTEREFTDPRGYELAAEYDRLMAEKTQPGRIYEVELAPKEHEYLDWDKPLSEQSEQVKARLQEFGLETAPPQFDWRMVSNPFRSAGRPEISDRYTLFVRANEKAPWSDTRHYFERSKSGGWDVYRQGRYAGALLRDTFEGEGAQSAMRQAESMVPRTAGIGPDTTGGEAYRLLSRGQEQQTSEALMRAGIPGIRYLDGGSRAAGDGSHNYVIFDPSHISIEAKYQRPAARDERVRAALNAIRVSPDERPLWQRGSDMVGATRARVREEFRTAVIDALDAIPGKNLDASISPFKNAHFTRELPEMMGAVVGAPQPDGSFAGGMLMLKDGAYVINPNSEPLGAINKTIFDAGKKDPFALWWIVNRAQRLMREGRENLISKEMIAEHRNDDMRPENRGANGENLFRDTLARLDKFNKAALDFGEQGGIINAEARKSYDLGDYVPFLREIGDEGKVIGPGRGPFGIANQTSGIRRLTGRDAKIMDPYESFYAVTEALVGRVLKNHAAQLTRDLTVPEGIMQKVSLAEQMASKGKPGDNIVSIMDKGKHSYYRVTAPRLYNAIAALGPVQTHAVIEMLGMPKRFLTKMVTHEPGYMAVSTMRDTVHAWQVIGGFTPGIDSVKGAVAAYRNSPQAMALMAGGGGGPHWYGRSPKAFIRSLEDGNWRPLNTHRKVWEALERVGSAGEMANRVAVAESVIKAGGTRAEANWQARDVMPYTSAGGSEIMKFLVQTVPFLNARVQGLDRMQRGFFENPASFMMRGAMITAASLALWAINRDNAEYQALTDYEKQAYWHLFLPGFTLRIPKPFEAGAIFGSIPEMLGDFIDNGNMHQAWGAFTNLILQQLNMDPTPQAVKPLLDVARNVRWSGGPIVSEAEENLVPGERFGPNTSTMMTALGQQIGFSPSQLEYLVKGYSGTLGSYFLAVTDEFTNAASGTTRPDRRLDQFPFVQRFVREQPSLANRWLNGFYYVKTEIDKLQATMNAMMKAGRGADAQALMRDNMELLWLRPATQSIAHQATAIRQAMRQISDAPNLTGGEKRERLDRLIAARSALGESARTIVERARP